MPTKLYWLQFGGAVREGMACLWGHPALPNSVVIGSPVSSAVSGSAEPSGWAVRSKAKLLQSRDNSEVHPGV